MTTKCNCVEPDGCLGLLLADRKAVTFSGLGHEHHVFVVVVLVLTVVAGGGGGGGRGRHRRDWSSSPSF